MCQHSTVMTDLTSGNVRHVAMLTKFFVGICLLSAVHGKSVLAPQTELTLTDRINDKRCMFPPTNLKFPDLCSETLKPEVSYENDNIDYYLCVALLDSTQRLCHITKGNKIFAERVSSALNDTLQSMMTSNGDDSVCKEMNMIDPNATYPQAVVIYVKMKQKFCPGICVGVGDSKTAQRETVCKSIQFAHQQIFAADHIRNELNIQGRMDKESEDNRAATKAAVIPGYKPKSPGDKPESQEDKPKKPQPAAAVESLALAVPQTSQRANIQGTPDESGTAPNIDAASRAKPSEEQSSTGNQPHPNASQVKESSKAGEPETKLVATSFSKTDNAEKVLPAETNENVKGDDDDTRKTDQESPDPMLNLDQNTNGGNDQDDGDSRGTPEDNEKTDDYEPNGQLEDIPEKSPSTERKVPAVPLQTPQHKTPQASMMGNFEESEDSHFFAYFVSLSALCILGYLVYHNKRKIIAMAVEGKKGKNTGRRRPNSASYHKLDSNLEEAMSSNLASTNSYVIY